MKVTKQKQRGKFYFNMTCPCCKDKLRVSIDVEVPRMSLYPKKVDK